MPTRHLGTPRFVAYDLVTGDPVMSGTGAHHMLTFTFEMPSLGVDNRFVEVLDCGLDASTIELPLVAARKRFTKVSRGDGISGLPPVALPADVELPRLGFPRLTPIGGL